MGTDLGTLLTANAYSPSAYTAAVAARAAYEAGQPATASLAKKYPLLAVVGDMVSDPDDATRDQEEGSAIASRFFDVSRLVVQSNVTYYMCLGDNVYQDGQLSNYQSAYQNSFGRVKGKTIAMPGNHEYAGVNSGTAADYYTYFGHLAGVPGRGYFAVNVANWRVYSLNSCSASWVTPGSAQMTWLAADLAANAGRPKLVGWHHPRWTDGATSAVTDDDNYDALWQLLYTAGGTQIVVCGHDHNYQRWDTIKSQGTGLGPLTDAAHGITQFVVGSGGNNFFNLSPLRNTGGAGNAGRSTWGHDRAFGVLYLRLGPSSWDWLFRSVDGVDLDAGTRAIH